MTTLSPPNLAGSSHEAAEPVAAEVRSRDGTRIGYLRLGQGPSVVFSHGSLTTGDDWLPVASRLAERFTCYVMSRRGRGRSGAGAAHSLERECDDIAAVLAAAGPGAHLLGHSYGAICALETALRGGVETLVLYEPPLPIDSATVQADDLAVYRAAIEAGRLEDALLHGFRHMIRMHEPELEELRKTPLWSDMVKLAATWLPEIEAVAGLPLGVERYRRLSMPTLLLVGSATQAHHVRASQALEQTLRNPCTVLLEGHGHMAHRIAPDIVAAAIAEFLPATNIDWNRGAAQ